MFFFHACMPTDFVYPLESHVHFLRSLFLSPSPRFHGRYFWPANHFSTLRMFYEGGFVAKIESSLDPLSSPFYLRPAAVGNYREIVVLWRNVPGISRGFRELASDFRPPTCDQRVLSRAESECGSLEGKKGVVFSHHSPSHFVTFIESNETVFNFSSGTNF